MSLVGIGYDSHRLVQGRRLVIGGVEIPHDRGLQGHSDADVLAHAITDALLGAAGLGDIGQHFPDTDASHEGADSIALLQQAVAIVSAEGYRLLNVDCTLVMERPKIAPYKQQIRERLAKTLGLPQRRVNVKASTGEGIGFVGRQEGVAALAVASLAEAG